MLERESSALNLWLQMGMAFQVCRLLGSSPSPPRHLHTFEQEGFLTPARAMSKNRDKSQRLYPGLFFGNPPLTPQSSGQWARTIQFTFQMAKQRPREGWT